MSVKRIKNLVKQLNEYRHAYYNQDAPLVSDAEYDRLFDELKELEEQTGFILSNSPTQTVGYYPVSELAKVTHPIPLLSLEKTKLISELLDFMKGQEVLFMLKLDGLTTKLIYEDGRLIQASTRGDGEVGEDITHNIPAFLNVPLTIPHKERLVITGESFIPTNDFERLKDTLRDGNGKPYKNGRNFASGSVRSLDPNPQCDSQITRRFVHFASKKAMNIEGLSEATLEKFLNLGYLHSFQDIYHLEEHREDIVALDGYGEKSFDRLWESINASRRTSFVRYLVSMDIPMIGRTKSRILDTVFSGNLTAFEQAAVGDYDFTQLEDFGEILNHNIHSWFADEANLDLWKNLQNEFTFEQRKEETIMTKENKFTGCTIVATGKLEHFTRDGINDKILELGAKPGSSVTKKTDYLICGEKAGSKLAKAQSLGIPILTEAEFLEMIA